MEISLNWLKNINYVKKYKIRRTNGNSKFSVRILDCEVQDLTFHFLNTILIKTILANNILVNTILVNSIRQIVTDRAWVLSTADNILCA